MSELEAQVCDYVLSFDPGGSQKTWAYALSSVRETRGRAAYGLIESGFCPTIEDLSRPDFSTLADFLHALVDRHQLGTRYTCDLVAERYVGRGHTGSLNEFIPFHLGFWTTMWQQLGLGKVRAIMASQWKLKAKKWNSSYSFASTGFENWWEDYFSFYLPTWDQKRSKSCDKHIQDACAIGWYYWYYEMSINCLPQGIKELLC